MKSNAVLGATLVGAVQAQQVAWAQCGGNGYSGATTCVSGYSCTYVNDWYSQCQPGSSNPPPPTTTLATVTVPATTTKGAATPTATSGGGSGKLKWLGSNQSGAEFGDGIYPGTLGKDYTWPDESEMQTLISQGYNALRVPFAAERLAPNGLAGSFDQTYLAALTKTINFITSKGASAILDPHNYGRYRGAVVTDTAAFGTFWKNLATVFKSNSLAIFDTNNEYNSMDQTLVLNLNQAAIDGIRAAGATSQYIFAEGNAWSGAWSWNTTNTNLVSLKDPQNKLVYEMHQYLDSDSSGKSADCVSAQIGVQRIVGATAWLRANGKKGFLGEFAGGANSVCQQAVTGLLDHLVANSDVWTGATWWAGGPWWGDYIYSFAPSSSTYAFWNPILKKYAP